MLHEVVRKCVAGTREEGEHAENEAITKRRNMRRREACAILTRTE